MENIIFGIGLISARLTIPLVIAVCGIFLLRICGKSLNHQNLINRLNRKLRAVHVPLGIMLAVMSFIHAIFSSTGLFFYRGDYFP